MKAGWLNLILRFSNRIYSRKQGLMREAGIKMIADIGALVFLEIILAVISLPLYLGMRTGGVTAYLEEKGGYARVAFDYSLRRVLTLAGVLIIFLLWTIKLAVIVGLPKVYGPLQLYSVSDFGPADILDRELAETETKIQTARVSQSMVKPKLKQVRRAAGGHYIFSGAGAPLETIVLLLSDRQTAIYYGQADAGGNWRIEHSSADFKLSAGNHSVLVFGYDDNKGARSEVAPEQFFKVQTAWIDVLAKSIDSLLNWTVAAVIGLGLFLTLLTL